jgi:hypothetical protein
MAPRFKYVPGGLIYVEEPRIFLMPERDPLLEEREKTHGSFARNAEISQSLKQVMHGTYSRGGAKFGTAYGQLNEVHAEALDMIALKLSRILSGQANHKDHWDDIAGYAKLATEACEEK